MMEECVHWTVQQWNQWFDSAQFDIEYEYHGRDLGAEYHKESTIWRLWSPAAQEVELNLYATGSDLEEGARRLSTVQMNRRDRGLWCISLEGDWTGTYYTYTVTVAGQRMETPDPYARAAGVNGRRSMVIDRVRTNPEGWSEDRRVLLENPTDAVIWEVHVRDFSWDPVSGMKHRGKYLAFTENSTHVEGHPELETGVEYLKRLGITHVHLLPCFDYATVDESALEQEQYNWGYDPENYNVPEGSYSTDPYHGEVRIREFKQMVQALHKAGIGVILDVVYNHVYCRETSALERSVPHYYFRTWPDGTASNGSGCGNEVATERPMVRQYILDSILYWVQEYHIDGFRFDLMGLYDVDTMNQIRRELDSLPDGRSILMYGEPWAAEPPQMRRGAVPADKSHVRLLSDRIAIFNDDTRACIKGSVFDMHSTGYINGAWYQETAVRHSFTGWAGPYSPVKLPTQTISYASAHDNFTLWDKLIYAAHKDPHGFDFPDPDCLASNKIAAVIVLLSQGIPFMQAGEEFGRTKRGDGNSYRSPSRINRLEWSRIGLFAELTEYYRGLIQIRQTFRPFRCATGKSIRRMVFSRISEPQMIAFTLPGEAEDPWRMAAVILNASDETRAVALASWEDEPLPKQWDVVADAQHAGVTALRTIENDHITVGSRSILVLADVR